MKKTLIFKYGDLLDVSVETFRNIQSAIMEITYNSAQEARARHTENATRPRNATASDCIHPKAAAIIAAQSQARYVGRVCCCAAWCSPA
jgi:hypothetical protein